MWLAITLLLSAAVLGGAWYYTQRDETKAKQKNNNSDQQTQSKSGQKYLKDIWDIEEIRDSIIFLKDNRYSAVIRTGAIDFRMMSEAEQEAVEEALIQTALSLSFDVQLYATSEYIDVEAAKQEIESEKENISGNPKLAKLQEEAIKFLDDIAKTRGTVRRNYIIVTHEGQPEKAYQELDRYCNIIISSLLRAKVPAHRLGSSEILDLVHSRLNRGSIFKPSMAAAAGAFDLYVDGMPYMEPYEGEVEAT